MHVFRGVSCAKYRVDSRGARAFSCTASRQQGCSLASRVVTSSTREPKAAYSFRLDAKATSLPLGLWCSQLVSTYLARSSAAFARVIVRRSRRARRPQTLCDGYVEVSSRSRVGDSESQYRRGAPSASAGIYRASRKSTAPDLGIGKRSADETGKKHPGGYTLTLTVAPCHGQKKEPPC